MVKCPGCGLDVEKLAKTWRYGVFHRGRVYMRGLQLKVQRIPLEIAI